MDNRPPGPSPGSAAIAPWVVAVLVFGVAFAAIAWVVVSAPGEVPAFDDTVGNAIHSLAVANGWLVSVGLVLEAVGGVLFSVLLSTGVVVMLLATGGARRPWNERTFAAVFLALSAAGGALLDSIIKAAVGRSRPPWNGLWSYESTPSFPSGHSQAGITVWVALGLVALVLLPRATRWFVAVPLLVVGPLIGISRAVLGVHWPTDVLGGWAMGAAWLSLGVVVVVLLAARTGASTAGPGPMHDTVDSDTSAPPT